MWYDDYIITVTIIILITIGIMYKIMKQITICIEQGKKPIKGTFELPEKWDEVSQTAYPFLAQIYLKPELAEQDKMTKTVQAFLLLSAHRRDLVKRLSADELYALLPAVDWVFEKVDLTINPTPQFFINKEAFFPPAAMLSNFRFAEWCIVDTLFVEYCRSHDGKTLNRLVACLYRPKGNGAEHVPGNSDYKGDIREKFNDSLLDDREMKMATLPRAVKDGIYLWFATCRQAIINKYQLVFEADPDEKDSLLSGFGWFGIYDDLRSDPKYAGSAGTLEEEFVHTVFTSMTRSHLKMKQFKKDNQ